MPRLYCERDGRVQEAGCIADQQLYREADEIVLIVSGTLKTGGWLCDRCNAEREPGDAACLVSAFPSHCRDELLDYDFGYERQYFAMNAGDKATAYGADWPDDSIHRRRSMSKPPRRPKVPLCASDLMPAKGE